MTGKSWAGDADPFRTDEAAQDGSEPWTLSREGWARELAIIPATGSDDPEWYIPYLQTITVKYDRQRDQIGMICHSSDMLILIEGRGLQPLAKLISQKKVSEIWVSENFSAADAAEGAVITAIRVTERSHPESPETL